MAVLGVDVGGTFTDAVLIADGELRTAKVRTAERQEESVLAAAEAVGADELERFTQALPALRDRLGPGASAADGIEAFLASTHLAGAPLRRAGLLGTL